MVLLPKTTEFSGTSMLTFLFKEKWHADPFMHIIVSVVLQPTQQSLPNSLNQLRTLLPLPNRF